MTDESAGQGRSWGIILLWVAPLIVGLGFFTYYWLAQPAPNTTAELPRLGQSVADFSLPDLKGQTVSLSGLKGKVVFLNVWATWCQPCVEEMPTIQRLHDQLQPRGLEVLTVSLDPLGAKIVDPFVKKYGLSFPVLLDVKSQIQKLYGTTGVPESFIIDKTGRLVEKIVGPRDWAHPNVLAMFERLMAAPSSEHQRG
ncbi:TlpA disulfide reductase family protein [Candidatus Entotheonella palauensis]|uniref:TlpA disulfide reductase family protein n=1 Tax=Candidatus Entotheonella palauensis TaxID=93172 RepID=UPI0015C42410|nr:TlpA disulfide reductase family protein [Candidatus Entotheonella palauensis]